MTEPLRASDLRLADEAWLRRTLDQHGERWIASHLGVSRETVRSRIAALGIEPKRPGRRQGVIPLLPARERAELDQTEQAILTAYRSALAHRTPATEDHVARQIRAMHEAKLAHDDQAYGAAIIDAIAALAVLDSHRRKLRRAA